MGGVRGKRRGALPEIEASRIVLRDGDGNVRIILDAGGTSGDYAHLYIASKDGRNNMQVGTQPSGAVVMNFTTPEFVGMLTLSADGMCLRARDGRLGVTIGRVLDGSDRVTVFENGQPVWQSRPAADGAAVDLGGVDYVSLSCRPVKRKQTARRKKGYGG